MQVEQTLHIDSYQLTGFEFVTGMLLTGANTEEQHMWSLVLEVEINCFQLKLDQNMMTKL